MHTQAGAAHEDADWYHRVLPRSVIGLSALLLSMALGAAFSGAVLFAYYEYRTDRSDSLAEEYALTFEDRLEQSLDLINQETEDAKAAIRSELEPLQQLAASGETLERLLEQVAPSVFFVSTRGVDGTPSAGTAFVVFSDADETFLLTSFNTVRAATASPGPPITLVKGTDEFPARLLTWEEGRDLALVSINRGGIERLPWAGGGGAGVGDRVFSISGLGAGGGAVTQGLIADVSGSGIQHDAEVGAAFQGGPLVNGNGEVLGVSSRTFAPLGFTPEAVFFAVPIRDSCAQVLSCPGGEAGGVGG
ncbi:MAG: S1C family serine protease [Acidimicrobiales bacterium]